MPRHAKDGGGVHEDSGIVEMQLGHDRHRIDSTTCRGALLTPQRYWMAGVYWKAPSTPGESACQGPSEFRAETTSPREPQIAMGDFLEIDTLKHYLTRRRVLWRWGLETKIM